jgi:signal transduction histidine kinase
MLRPAKSFGLSGMAERAKLLDGQFRVRSAPGLGTVIAVEVPVEAAQHD